MPLQVVCHVSVQEVPALTRAYGWWHYGPGGHFGCPKRCTMASADLRADQQRIVERFLMGLTSGDKASVFGAYQQLEYDGLPVALQAVVASDIHPNDQIREGFLFSWVMREGIRQDVEDDELLLDAMARPLPAYDGPDMKLYRGEVRSSHDDGTHGWAWTSNPEVAKSYAGFAQRAPSGGVFLAVQAPAEAIFCAPALFEHPRDGEDEYMVDRRVLLQEGAVIEVLEVLPPVERQLL